MSLNDFEIIKRLGEGAYSSVYYVRRIVDNEYYALKKVRMQKLSDKEKENALNEVRILASIRHPNIVAYREAFIDDASQSLCIVMEYADSGDLFQQICEHQKNNTLFKEEDIWKMFIQMVRGLRCLHEIMIFHRDLKSANVFLNKDSSAKLGDMNVSKVAKKGMLYTQTGTPYYASPEVWRDQPYDNKSDIWSLGCVLYESITLKPPFRADDMQGLYKKVLRGVYPKIPNIYSADLANLVKALIQVTPQMRPSCERILELPIVRKRIERLFPQDEFYDSQSSLLNTIRVPKNLLYLTDRLPKPSYESPAQKKKLDEEEMRRRKTHDAGNMLPEIKNQKKPSTKDHQTQQQQPQANPVASSKRSRKQNKNVRVRSDLRGGDSQLQENYSVEESASNNKVGTAASQAAEDDRRSVVSKGSVSQPHSSSTKEQIVIRKNSQKQKGQQQAVVGTQRTGRDQSVRDNEDINEEYEDEQFEREDHTPLPKSKSLHGAAHQIEDRDSSHYDQPSSPPLHNLSPVTKRSQGKVSLPTTSSQPVPSPQMILLSNRPPQQQQSHGAVQSVERIYVQKPSQAQLPSLIDQSQIHNQPSKKNLAYINISGEGAKPVGYLGLKKAEKDLIMRRYKYNHHASDHIQRVAMIYGQGNPQVQSTSGSQYSYNYSGNQQYVSPYLANQLAYIQGPPNNNNNISGIIKRNKYAPQQVIEENSTVGSGGVGGQAQIRLPKLPSVGRQLDHNGINQQSQAMLPPLGGAITALNGQGILGKAQQQIYQPYIVKPSKIKSISKPLLGPSQGVSGERINISKYSHSLVEPTSSLPPPISRSNQLQNINTNSSQQQLPGSANESKKIYSKKAKGIALGSVSGIGGVNTRNIAGGMDSAAEVNGTGGSVIVGASNDYE